MISGSVFTILGLLLPDYYLFAFKFDDDSYVCSNLSLGIILTLLALLLTVLNDLGLKGK